MLEHYNRLLRGKLVKLQTWF